MILEPFVPCRMQQFAQFIGQEFGISVVLEGTEIKVDLDSKTIFLPNFENPSEEDMKPMLGFCLHEAGHIAYSSIKVLEHIDNYVLKSLHNMLEDEYIERLIERDFAGGRDILLDGYTIGIKKLFPDMKIPNQHGNTFLGEEGMAQTMSSMQAHVIAFIVRHGQDHNDDIVFHEALGETGIDFNDREFVEQFAKKLELDRIMRLWFNTKRRYPYPTYDYETHPWKEVFEQETAVPARNSMDALNQSIAIMERIGIKPLKMDRRPVATAKKKMEKALELQREAADIANKLEVLKREIDGEISSRHDASSEQQDLLGKQDISGEAREALRAAKQAAREANADRKEAKESSETSKKRLEGFNRRLASLQDELENADGEAKEEIARKIADLEGRISAQENVLGRRLGEIDEAKKRREETKAKRDEAQAKYDEAKNAENEARQKSADKKAEIDSQVREEYEEVCRRAENKARRASKQAQEATDDANRILRIIKRKDEKTEAVLAPGAVKQILDGTFDKYRGTTLEQEMDSNFRSEFKSQPNDDRMGDAMELFGEGETPTYTGQPDVDVPLPPPSRNYCPFTRRRDRLSKVTDSDIGMEKFKEGRLKYVGLMEDTKTRLRRLYAPVKTRVKVNATAGRLNAGQAYKFGLVLNKVNVDLSRVWKEIVTTKMPRVAVSLVVDHSLSMTRPISEEPGAPTRLDIARQSAACLSEVLSSLSITHEIVGHTTDDTEAELLVRSGQISQKNVEAFSRVSPFVLLDFKQFDQKGYVPSNLFATTPNLGGNFDGEALLYAASRLCNRQEKTKILIAIGDGKPNARFSYQLELWRHLYAVCRHLERFENKGMFLYGVGVGEAATAEFYKNAYTINDVSDLPKVTLGLVENVLTNIVGSM